MSIPNRGNFGQNIYLGPYKDNIIPKHPHQHYVLMYCLIFFNNYYYCLYYKITHGKKIFKVLNMYFVNIFSSICVTQNKRDAILFI